MSENPPAFPTDGRIQHGAAYDGMTLRDYFAGQALAAVIDAMQNGTIAKHPVAGYGPAGFAASSYDIADALLAARKTPAA